MDEKRSTLNGRLRAIESNDDSNILKLYRKNFPKEFQWFSDERILDNTVRDADYCSEASFIYEVEEAGVVRAAGIIITKLSQDYEKEVLSDTMWITMLAVREEYRGCGVGSVLLDASVKKAKELGIKEVVLGMEFRNLFSGIPAPDDAKKEFFKKAGFILGEKDHYDMSANMQENFVPDEFDASKCVGYHVKRMEPQDADKVLGFLLREFPDRWHFEIDQYIKTGGDLKQVFLLIQESDGDVVGFSMTHDYGDADRSGGLGPIGIGSSVRGKKLGGLILTKALIGLREQGVRETCIDWTGLVDFYGKYGFHKERAFRAGSLSLK
ncbi:GNAT family N-acetyltransferase [Butyrivibrio sp. WCD3002]|uniref:GNAT family N-acetyltransferase n=1 Tax=Butyrivibrio sp. WCD3002 TaxID=1280676 RepID=UPI000402CFC1|nr:GNAT family N-acetyltransferase [Butyrivibrio sp. WCD3002]